MLELARRRLGPDTDLHLVDLADPLPFPDSSLDDVIEALVLHYLEDWTGPLAELRRVLEPGGRLMRPSTIPSRSSCCTVSRPARPPTSKPAAGPRNGHTAATAPA